MKLFKTAMTTIFLVTLKRHIAAPVVETYDFSILVILYWEFGVPLCLKSDISLIQEVTERERKCRFSIGPKCVSTFQEGRHILIVFHLLSTSVVHDD